MPRRILKISLFAAVAILAVAQFFPPERSNPPTNPAASFEAVARPDPALAAVVNRACSDCHSNNTVWPWYSRIAPVSWLIASDVREGRARLNFSEWNLLGPDMARQRLAKACEEARTGEMPPKYYTPAHPRAKLTERDVAAICGGGVAALR